MAGGGRIKGITIELDGDTKGLQSALKDVNKSSKEAQSELKEVERALKLDPANVELVNQKMDVLADAVNAASDKLKVLKQAQAQVEAQFANGDIGEEQYRAFQRELIETESAMKQYQNQMGNMQNEQKRLSDTTRAMGAFFDATGTQVEDFASTLGTRLTNAISSGTATADQMEKALKLMGQRALGASTDIDAMRDALNGINDGNSIEQVRNNLMALNKSVVTTQDELKQVEQLLKLNPGNTTALAQKQQLLTKAISETTSELQQLQQRQQQVEAAFANGNMGAKEYRAFQREIAKTEQTLAEYDAKLRGMGSETTRFNQAQQAMQNYMNSTAQTINDLSSVLGSQLTNAIRSGSATSDQLEQALRRLGQAAGHSGADLERFEQIVRNVDGSNNLDQIRRDLERIGDAADEAEGKMKGLGDSISGALGGLVAGGGLAGAVAAAFSDVDVKAIIDVTFDVPESSKASVLAAVRGVQAYGVDAEAALEGVRRQWALNGDASDESNARVVKAAGVVAKAYADIDFQELIQEANEIGGVLGITTEEAVAMTNALLKAGFDPNQLDIISEYGNQLKMAGFNAQEIQAIMASGVDTKTWNIDNLLDGIKEGRIVGAEFGAEIDKSTKEIIESAGLSADKFQELGKAIAGGGEEGGAAMQEMAKMLATVDDATIRNQLGTAMYGTLWEEQGTKIVDTLMNMGDHMTTADENAQLMNDTISGIDGSAMVQMQSAIQGMMEALGPVFEKIAEIVTKIAEWVSANPQLAATIVAITTAVGILVGIIAVLMPIITAIATAMGVGMAAAGGIFVVAIAAIIAIVVGIIAVIQNWSTIWEWLKGIMSSFATWLGSVFVAAVGILPNIFVAVWTAISTTAQVVWNGLLTMLSSIWSGIVSAATTIWNMLVSILTGLWNGIVSVAVSIWNGLSSTLSSIWSTIASTAASVWNGLVTIFTTVTTTIQTVLTTVWTAIQSAITAIWNGIVAVATSVWNGLKNTITTVVNGIKTVVTTGFNAVKTTTTTVFNAIKMTATTVWNAIKTTITTVINGIKTTITTVFNTIKSTITSVFSAIQSTASSVWNAIKSVITNAVNGIKSTVTTVFNAIKSTVQSVMSGVQSVIQTTWNAAKSVVTNAVNGIKSIVTSVFNSLKSTVSTAMNGVKSAIESGWNAAKSFLQGIDLSSIGRGIIEGLVNGIKGAAGSVASAIKGVADGAVSAAKKALGINSPSRVMRDHVGRWVGEGLAEGITRTSKAVVKVTTNLAKGVINTAKKVLDIHSPSREMRKIGEYTADGLGVGLKNKTNSVAKIAKASSVTIMESLRQGLEGETSKIEAAYANIKDVAVKAIRDIESIEISDTNIKGKVADALYMANVGAIQEQVAAAEAAYAEYDRLLKNQFAVYNTWSNDPHNKVSYWTYYNEQLEQARLAYEQTLEMDTLNDKIEKYYKIAIDSTKDYITQKGRLGELAIGEEVTMWSQLLNSMSIHSDAYYDVLANHQNAVKAVRQNIEKANEDHMKRMQEIDEELIERTKELNREYDDAYKERLSTLVNFADTFDEFKVDTETTGKQLIDNLLSQVNALDAYADVWSSLSGRITDADLLAELSELGPKSLGELQALNSLTDDELESYMALYREKFNKASQIATEELSPMKDSITEQIRLAEESAAAQLEQLNVEWQLSIQQLVEGTETELDSLEQVGVDAATGLLNGLSSMQSSLVSKATEIANAIKSTIQSALDIHSPSRVMKGFGVNIGEGLIIGMDDMINGVAKSSARLSDAVVGAQASLSNSAASSRALASNVNNTTQTVDNRKSFAPVVQIYTTESPEKIMQRELRRMAFQF